MSKRFLSIWFDHLKTDFYSIREPGLKTIPFVLRVPSHGKMIISAANILAEKNGISTGMAVADARAILPKLEVQDDQPGLEEKLIKRIAEWCIRFSPFVSMDLPDGILMDVSGCSHLWGGDLPYINDILKKFNARGYSAGIAMADTAGAAWGLARYSRGPYIAEKGLHANALLDLPPEALRIETAITERLYKLGLRRIRDFIAIPRVSLKRRFGDDLIKRINQALGTEEEFLEPVLPIEPFEERLPCLEPILTRTGVEIGLRRTLENLCFKLSQEEKGLRNACFKAYRADGKISELNISTSRASHHVEHLYRLFEDKLSEFKVEPGIELFTLTTSVVEDLPSFQEKIWESSGGLNDIRLAELIDRLLASKGLGNIQRFLPAEHHLPEKSVRPAVSLTEEPSTAWRTDQSRPLHLLSPPEQIEVTAPIPDYPPMMFRYKGKIHKIKKADGPERIEQEWWVARGRHRDYYHVEDEEGKRYWLFRSGHYDETRSHKWFIHGFFA
ncbi:MAG TPA: DNA polymerase Y family protein [Chitinophagaceae bacterium]|nr:DNA polymerase Y family protein [Chitinophagaceae bacterium]